ncbi:hypothetical protein [Tritonibacter horizontis]|uniref:Uncharacterized protein n=1 Tax=Tritonibacter horizontis TaxID=1768241 RepID=A0A132BVV6_9RHOB|nr:hypothetical protein [Tritonibacter horizontis]KUP92202.1 hypothetical protein TRIHO_28400 [Tritonibacter horizontis]
MTTKHVYRFDFYVAAEHAAACNRAANALGRDGDNFRTRLSSTGEEPATHLGGSTVETALFVAAVASAPALPAGVDWPEGLVVGDWQAVADHLSAVSRPADSPEARGQFDALIAQANLHRIKGD